MVQDQPCRGRLGGSQGRVDDLRVGAQDLFELVESLLELTAVAGAQAWLLALSVLAVGAIAATPPTGRLPAVAFYLHWVLSISVFAKSCAHIVFGHPGKRNGKDETNRRNSQGKSGLA